MQVMQRLIKTDFLLEDLTGKQKQGLELSAKFSLHVQGTFGKGMPYTTPLVPSPHPSGPNI